MVKKSAQSKLLAPNLPSNLPLAHITEFHDEDCIKLKLSLVQVGRESAYRRRFFGPD